MNICDFHRLHSSYTYILDKECHVAPTNVQGTYAVQ